MIDNSPVLANPSVRRVQDALDALGGGHRVVALAESARTAADAARALGCRVDQIVKSLVFRGRQTERAILVAASGGNRLADGNGAGPVAAAVARGPVVPPAARALARDVEALSAPDMEGRRSGTPGGERAARRIAEWIEAAGLRPGGEHGTFFQWFAVETGIALGPANELALARPGGRRFEVGREWTPHGGSLTGALSAEVVLAGWGATSDDGSFDDYAGLDVRGRIVVALDRTPRALGTTRVSRLDQLIAAPRHGAAPPLLVADALPPLDATAARVGLISGTLTRQAAGALQTGDRVSLRVDLAAAARPGANVAGILPGPPPALAHRAGGSA